MTATVPTTRRRRVQSTPRPESRPFPQPTDISETLVENNLGLARQAAWKWSRKTGQSYEDLEAVAFVGLIRGCRRYDPTRINPSSGRPYALSTVAVPFIEGEILHWFRDKGHAIRFPSRWREAWGKVQRLLSDPAVPADQVATLAGLTQADLDEMLASMTGTVNLDDTIGADATPGPEIEEPDRLAPLQQLVTAAWANLHQADQTMLLAWWNRPHRQAIPVLQLKQFHRRLQSLLRGRRLIEVLQLQLVEVQTVAVDPKPRTKRKAREILDQAVQLGLL